MAQPTSHVLYLTNDLSRTAAAAQVIARTGFAVDLTPLSCFGDVDFGDYALLLFDYAVVDGAACQLLTQILHDKNAPAVIVLIDEFASQTVADLYQRGGNHVIVKDADACYLSYLPFVIQQVIETTRSLADLSNQNDALSSQVADLDAYADNVAHDLKNPITHFLSYADDLRENYTRMSPAEIDYYLEIIVEQSRKMNEIVEDLLLLARTRLLEKLDTEELEMAFIVTTALARLQDEIHKKNAEIELPPSWPVAEGYAPWVEGVWVNYLSNGLKYGGSPPHLTLGATREPDNMIRYWVKDNGSGLTDSQQQKLFKPFPKLGHSAEHGHGLGLTIVRRIIERLGGIVGVESQPGAGSTFYFTLPASSVETNRA